MERFFAIVCEEKKYVVWQLPKGQPDRKDVDRKDVGRWIRTGFYASLSDAELKLSEFGSVEEIVDPEYIGLDLRYYRIKKINGEIVDPEYIGLRYYRIKKINGDQ